MEEEEDEVEPGVAAPQTSASFEYLAGEVEVQVEVEVQLQVEMEVLP